MIYILNTLFGFFMLWGIFLIIIYPIYLRFFYPWKITLSKLDKDTWTQEDYRVFYAQCLRDLYPLSKREKLIVTIVERYEGRRK